MATNIVQERIRNTEEINMSTNKTQNLTENTEDITMTTSLMKNLTGNTEWRTPEKYINSVKDVLGPIDTDPASNDEAQALIQAGIHHNVNDNGLDHSWMGRTFMNPPYSRALIPKFTNKFLSELKCGHITTGIVLVNAATDSKWFHNLINQAQASCFTKGRISFLRPGQSYQVDNGKKGQIGSAFLYFGDDVDSFTAEFSQYGFIL